MRKPALYKKKTNNIGADHPVHSRSLFSVSLLFAAWIVKKKKKKQHFNKQYFNI